MSQVPEALESVRASLDALAGSLESGSADDVLDAETPLATAVHALVVADRQTMTPEERRHLAESIRSVRQSVARCARLGNTSGDLIRAVFPRAVYGPEGQRPAESKLGPSLVSKG